MTGRRKVKSYYERNRDQVLEKTNRRYRENKKYREAARLRARRRYHEDEQYREQTINRAKQRYRRLKARGKKTKS